MRPGNSTRRGGNQDIDVSLVDEFFAVFVGVFAALSFEGWQVEFPTIVAGVLGVILVVLISAVVTANQCAATSRFAGYSLTIAMAVAGYWLIMALSHGDLHPERWLIATLPVGVVVWTLAREGANATTRVLRTREVVVDPYLREYRLQDIVGLLQFLGAYKEHQLSPEDWYSKLDYKPRSAATWAEVFRDHPEFFRVNDNGQVGLVWRKALPRVSTSRQVLSEEQIGQLIAVALDFHSKARDRIRDSRWWIPIAAALLAFLGALLGAMIRAGGTPGPS
ncbi:MAG: hypothetical protein AAGA68_00015 [Pseudomonadota bacterium]